MSSVVVRNAMSGLLRRKGRPDVAVGTFTVGTTKPAAANTGVQAGVTLVPKSGDLTITTAGTTVENEDRTGRYLVRAANVTIRNCRARAGSGITTNSALVDCNHSAASNVLIEFCDLAQDVPTVWLNGVIGHDYVIRRCNIWRVVDGAGVYNSTNPSAASGVTIEGNFIHDLCYMSPDSNHSDNRTHNDGVQVQGNTGTIIRGNTVNALSAADFGSADSAAVPAANPYYPSVTGQAIGLTPNVSAITGTVIDQNWLDGGAQSITAIPQSYGAQNIGSITGNRFGRTRPQLTKDGTRTERPILIHTTLTATGVSATTAVDTNGNVYEDTGLPVTVYRSTTV